MGSMNESSDEPLNKELFPQPVLSVNLHGAADFDGFRLAARRLLARRIEPDKVQWKVTDTAAKTDTKNATATPPQDLFDDSATTASPPDEASTVNVPPDFMTLCRTVVQHSNPNRFALLYRLLWRLANEPTLRRNPLDPDMMQAQEWARAVREDIGTVNPAIAQPQSMPLHSLEALREATNQCRECPIGEFATQAVNGEGPLKAKVMFVGEQPGDQEDLRGHPFVGPAGQLFNRALLELGVHRGEVFVTNAVRHFKFELRGKRRIHKTPTQREASVCLHWLEKEIALIQPEMLVALGATAARSLMGKAIPVTAFRGQLLERSDGLKVLITLHPSALLRAPPELWDEAYAAWLKDLSPIEHAMS